MFNAQPTGTVIARQKRTLMIKTNKQTNKQTKTVIKRIGDGGDDDDICDVDDKTDSNKLKNNNGNDDSNNNNNNTALPSSRVLTMAHPPYHPERQQFVGWLVA